MQYRVNHETIYRYSSNVTISHNQNRLRPRHLPYQQVESSIVTITPSPTSQRVWIDGFGNFAEFFSLEYSHSEMTVESTSIVTRSKQDLQNVGVQSWKSVAKSVEEGRAPADRLAAQFVYDSLHARRFTEALQYAEKSFDPERSIMDAVMDLTTRIHRDFKYDTQATQVSTPTIEVLEGKRGVCQDFAHLQISCLRSLGIPARYVSGYLLTYPVEGKEAMVGYEASHAWVSAYMGNDQWVDFDPTNNLIPGEEHITIGWGRDYNDVMPVQGVTIGSGNATLSVIVEVRPI